MEVNDSLVGSHIRFWHSAPKTFQEESAGAVAFNLISVALIADGGGLGVHGFAFLKLSWDVLFMRRITPLAMHPCIWLVLGFVIGIAVEEAVANELDDFQSTTTLEWKPV